MDYVIRAETPTAEVYRHLRAASGLSPKSPEAATAGLVGTWHAVVAYHDARPAGMGRVLGDGGTAFQIVDMYVLTDRGRPCTPPHTKYGFTQTAPESVGMALQL